MKHQNLRGLYALSLACVVAFAGSAYAATNQQDNQRDTTTTSRHQFGKDHQQNQNQNKNTNPNRGRQGGSNQGGFGKGSNQGGFGQGNTNRNRNQNQGGFGKGSNQGGFGQGTTHRNRNQNQGGFGKGNNQGGFGQGTGNRNRNQGGFGQGNQNRNRNQGGFGQGTWNRNRNRNQGGFGQGTHNQGGFGQGVLNQIFGQRNRRNRNGQPRIWNWNASGWSRDRYDYDRNHYAPRVKHFGHGGWGSEWRYGYRGPRGFNPGYSFGYYYYSPYRRDVVPSPWYFYRHLPPYLGLTSILVLSGIDYDWSFGTIYGYTPGIESRWSENEALDASIDDLRNAFLNHNQDAIAELVPPGRNVAIYNGGSYMYSMNGGEFEQLMADNVANTQTTGFQIRQVRVYGDLAVVSCQHDFIDADGNSQAVYQQYRMQRYGDRYVIVGMRTSSSPF